MIWGIIICGLLVALDQITKYIIVSTMTKGQSIPVIKDFFYITSHRNTGSAWGMLEGQMVFFYIITVIALVVFVYLFYKAFKNGNLFYKLSGILFIAGTLGNFIDRIVKQEVVDFLDFYIFSYDFPIFNVADMCLTIGVIAFIIYIVFYEGKENKKDERNN